MKFTQHELGPGVRLHLCPTDKFKTLTCKVFIQQELRPWEAASTALVPLLLRRGSQKLPTTLDLARQLEELYAADFGSDVLKIGERQILEFQFQMIDPSYLPQGNMLMRRGLETFWEIASRPYGNGSFHEPYFEQEKHTLLQELEGLVNDKRAYALARCTALMCQGEPFGIYKYGDADTVRSLANQEVYGHYQKLLHSYPLDIFVVGSQAEQAAQLLAELIPGREGQIQLEPAQQVEVGQPRYFEEHMDVQQAVVVMGYRTNTSYLDEDYYALLVGNGILGGFAHSKLFINVRERAQLAYYVWSSLEGSKGLLTISAGIGPEQQGQALQIIEAQVREVQEGRISPEELEQTKLGLIRSMNSMNDSPSGLIDRNLIGIVHDRMRTIEEVVESIAVVDRKAVVRAMEKVQLDTTYILRPSPQKGADHGTD
ncbi:MAG TPA: pitrilysin family protein [Limnochordia bacterium]|nr:pitrilysin family protein [Limnochordia bacterium]